MVARIQSPNSINTYKRCPRKYYYEYILKLKSLPSIHLIRGNIVHTVLEDFFKLDISFINSEHYEFELKVLLNNLLKKHWENSKDKIDKLNLEKKEIDFYFRETMTMLDNWFLSFIKRLNKNKEDKNDLISAFKSQTPETEAFLVSEKHMIRGYVDTIYKKPKGIYIIDYKTSKRPKIIPEYKLQLAIYSMLYYEIYGVKPRKVGIDFLRNGDNAMFLDVDEDLMNFAKKECELIHEKTKSKNIEDYPKTPSKLCDYSKDCCRYYEKLIEQRNLKDFMLNKG